METKLQDSSDYNKRERFTDTENKRVVTNGGEESGEGKSRGSGVTGTNCYV